MIAKMQSLEANLTQVRVLVWDCHEIVWNEQFSFFLLLRFKTQSFLYLTHFRLRKLFILFQLVTGKFIRFAIDR